MENVATNEDNYAYAKDKIGTAESVHVIADLITHKEISDPEVFNRLMQSQIDYIADEINFAIHIGQYHVLIPMDMRWEVREMLTKLGYRVHIFKYPDPMEDVFTQEFVWIEW